MLNQIVLSRKKYLLLLVVYGWASNVFAGEKAKFNGATGALTAITGRPERANFLWSYLTKAELPKYFETPGGEGLAAYLKLKGKSGADRAAQFEVAYPQPASGGTGGGAESSDLKAFKAVITAAGTDKEKLKKAYKGLFVGESQNKKALAAVLDAAPAAKLANEIANIVNTAIPTT